MQKFYSIHQWPVVMALFFSIVIPCIGIADGSYPGWNKSSNEKKNAVVFRPANAFGEVDILVKYYAVELLENKGPDEWLREKLNNSKAPRGIWQGELSVIRGTANVASGSRRFTQTDGSVGRLEAMAFSADRQYVRLAVIIFSHKKANEPYLKQAVNILSGIINVEKANALAQDRGHDLESSPPKVNGIKAGGFIKPGRYIGSKTNGQKVLRRYEIILYENGEYEFLNSGDSGRFVYSQATGRLNIEGDFYNSTYDPHDEFCIFGVNEETGKHTIYAEERIMSRYKFRLVWNNPVDRLSPSERKQAKELANAEANRYRHVTNPGDGVLDERIETILYTFETRLNVGGMTRGEEVYLLMKDGRVMDGVPVPPDMLDIAKSRSREPDRWGWWKRDDKRFSFAWNVDKKNYVIPKGTQIQARPIPAGTKLNGRWSSSSSFTSLDFSSTSFWGVTLDENGRFEKYRNNMMQGGGEMAGLGPLVTTASNDEGTVTSVIGSNVGGGITTKNNKPASDRMGWYEFDGYNLTLKFDNGTVERLLTFTTDDEFNSIWFEGGTLQRDARRR